MGQWVRAGDPWTASRGDQPQHTGLWGSVYRPHPAAHPADDLHMIQVTEGEFGVQR